MRKGSLAIARRSRRLRLEQFEDRAVPAAFNDFTPLPASTPAFPGGNPEKPFVLPDGFDQVVFAREGDGGTIDDWDMNTQNEIGLDQGRYLYRTHETSSGSQVSVTDLRSVRQEGPIVTSDTKVLAQRADWERFDGIVWTPWGTILAAEETFFGVQRDPQVPQALAGLVYELFVDRSDPSRLDPRREVVVDLPGVDVDRDGTIDTVQDGIRARPAIGSRSHEGMRFDEAGNLYGITETPANLPPQSEPRPPFIGGFIYKFTPDRPGDLSRGQLYALRVLNPTVADRTGAARWVPLNRTIVQIYSDFAAGLAGATGYNRPEDVETDVVTGRTDPLGDTLYVAITDEDRVLAIDLARPNSQRTFVWDYVRDGLNAPADFDSPDNLALDHTGMLYITEDAGGPLGDDIWAAFPPDAGQRRGAAADRTVRFASLTDSRAEPTGIYFDIHREVLYVNVQHRGGDGRDLAVAIFPTDVSGVGRSQRGPQSWAGVSWEGLLGDKDDESDD